MSSSQLLLPQRRRGGGAGLTGLTGNGGTSIASLSGSSGSGNGPNLRLFQVALLLIVLSGVSVAILAGWETHSTTQIVSKAELLQKSRGMVMAEGEQSRTAVNQKTFNRFKSSIQLPPGMTKPPKGKVTEYITHVVRDWWDANKTPPPSNTVTVAFCKYDQNEDKYYPDPQNEWLAWWIVGHHAFPERHMRFAPCIPHSRLLPPDVSAESEEGMRLLGLVDVDIRFCQWGSTDIIRIMEAASANGGGMRASIDVPPLLAARGIQRTPQQWSHNSRLHWPDTVTLIMNKAIPDRPMKPFLIRENLEPWMQESRGIGIQFEAKRETEQFPVATVAMFQPHLINSVGRRLAPGAEQNYLSEWTRIAHGYDGPYPDSVEEMLVRGPDFNPALERTSKKYFAAFVNGHCRTLRGGSMMLGVVIRELFAFALATYKPVNALGKCPLNHELTPRLGTTHQERARLTDHYRNQGTVQVYHDHKFVIVFENSHTHGYLSEKLLNGYASRSVPIYFGTDEETLVENLNPKAFVFCRVPLSVGHEEHLQKYRRHVCKGMNEKDEKCEVDFQQALAKLLAPHFEICIDEVKRLDVDDAAYDAMISEPLVPDGKAVGIWNRTLTGELLREVYTTLRFDY